MCAKLVYQSRNTGPDQAGYSDMVVKDMSGHGPLFFEKHVQIQLAEETWEEAARKALSKLTSRTNFGQQGKVIKNTVLVMQHAVAQGLLAHLMKNQATAIDKAPKNDYADLDGFVNTRAIVLEATRGSAGLSGTAYEGGTIYLGVQKITGTVTGIVHFSGYKKTGSRNIGSVTS